MTTDLFSQEPAGSAVLSPCGKYRYFLRRKFGESPKTATFIMLNPSTANAETDDPTIRKCKGFARLWECGSLQVVNLFAFRATDPRDLWFSADPVGPENGAHILSALGTAHGPVVCAWGTRGGHRNRDRAVMKTLVELGIKPFALAITKDGFPQHPLYVSYVAALMEYMGRPS